MQVEELMSRSVATCAPHDTLNHVARLLWEHDCGVLPVVDRDRYVVGMITDRDVCMAAYTKGRLLAHIRVADVMSRRVHVIRDVDSIESAQHRMAEFQVRRLPVVDASEKLVGLLSLNDLARHAHRTMVLAPGPSADAVVWTLARIGARHGVAGSSGPREEWHAQAS